jgi:hypothetical protein
MGSRMAQEVCFRVRHSSEEQKVRESPSNPPWCQQTSTYILTSPGSFPAEIAKSSAHFITAIRFISPTTATVALGFYFRLDFDQKVFAMKRQEFSLRHTNQIFSSRASFWKTNRLITSHHINIRWSAILQLRWVARWM